MSLKAAQPLPVSKPFPYLLCRPSALHGTLLPTVPRCLTIHPTTYTSANDPSQATVAPSSFPALPCPPSSTMEHSDVLHISELHLLLPQTKSGLGSPLQLLGIRIILPSTPSSSATRGSCLTSICPCPLLVLLNPSEAPTALGQTWCQLLRCPCQFPVSSQGHCPLPSSNPLPLSLFFPTLPPVNIIS